MNRTPKSPMIPANYMQAWARLFTRSPAELEADRRASSPAMPGTKRTPHSAKEREQ